MVIEIIVMIFFALCLIGAGLQLITLIIGPPKRKEVLNPELKNIVPR